MTATLTIRIQPDDFDAAAEGALLTRGRSEAGALVTFTGICRSGEGDEAAMKACDEQRFKDGKRTSSAQRPSMGQDMQKGRRTEIEFINGLVVREGEKLGMTCTANAALTDIVKRVERGELKPDPRHITELRLN